MKNQMGKDVMKERILEAIKAGDERVIRRRVEVCLAGLRSEMTSSKDGMAAANELIDELGLEKYGARKEDSKPS